MVDAIDRQLLEVAVAEVERQEASPTHVLYLLNAFEQMTKRKYLERSLYPSLTDVLTLGRLVEPEKNQKGFRRTPVAFANGGTAVHHSVVPTAMYRLCDTLKNGGMFSFDGQDKLHWIKSFLEIHPFEDGNGRVAWVLHHWLNDFQIAQPLPRFDFMPIGDKL